MGRWGRKGSGATSPDAAYDTAIAAGQAGDFRKALRTIAQAEELFVARGDVDARAGAARSAWRAANYHAAVRAPDDAIEAGRRAVDAWTAVVAETGNQAWNRELVRACADVSVFAVMAGHHDEAVTLASRAVEIARTAKDKGLDMSRDLQTELGTALHNLAAAHSSRAVARGSSTDPRSPTDPRSQTDLQAALRAADDEVRLRRTLAGSGPDLAAWELASGLCQRGRIRMVAGELQSARYDLVEARGLATRLGPAGQTLLAEATAALHHLGAA